MKLKCIDCSHGPCELVIRDDSGLSNITDCAACHDTGMDGGVNWVPILKCPLCGKEMDFDGSIFTCENESHTLKSFDYVLGKVEIFISDLKHYFYDGDRHDV